MYSAAGLTLDSRRSYGGERTQSGRPCPLQPADAEWKRNPSSVSYAGFSTRPCAGESAGNADRIPVEAEHARGLVALATPWRTCRVLPGWWAVGPGRTQVASPAYGLRTVCGQGTGRDIGTTGLRGVERL
jgi:hypothetical protein